MNPAKSKILILERDEAFRKMLHLELTYKGFQVESCPLKNLPAALSALAEVSPTLAILDGEGAQGIVAELAQYLRAQNNNCWLIAILKQASLQERVQLLEAGMDDYFLQPFAVEELIAKIRNVIHRLERQHTENLLEYVDVKMDLIQRLVWRGSRLVELRSKEFDLLKVFMMHPEQVLSREFIFDHVWGSNFLGDSNVIEVYIRYLREKLAKPNLLKTRRGKGYIFISDEAQIKQADLSKLENR